MQFLTGHYWALFDGHGGPAAAILAANTLHSCLRRQLEAVVEGMVATQPPMHLSGHCIRPSDPQFVEEKGIRAEDLVVGALESAFQECVSVTFGWERREGFTLRDLRDSGLWGVPAHDGDHPGSLDWEDKIGLVGLLLNSYHNPTHLSSAYYMLGAFTCIIFLHTLLVLGFPSSLF